MKKCIIILSALAIISGGAFAGVKYQKANQLKGTCLAGQGCCSWHGGQCGCTSSGRVMCCDGTTSPSCRCW